MPSGFKLNSTTLKYNGLEDPEAWLDDYLTAVKFQRGTNITAMQYIQLMLDAALAEESPTRINQLVEAILRRLHRKL